MGPLPTRERDFISNPYGSGRFVDRVELGRRLRSVAEAEGATVTEVHRLRSLNRIAGRWYVECQASGRSLHWSADAVVDASGRSRALLRALGIGVRTDAHLVALHRRFALPPATEDALPRVTLLESSAFGWWYAAPQPEQAELLVMLVTDRTTLRETGVHRSECYSSALERTHHVSRWVRRCARSSSLSPRGVDAQIGGATQISDASGWLSVGDAAMTLDPLSSRGISSALASSLHAAHALTAWRQGDTTALARYGAQLRAVYAAHLEQRLVHYRSERRFPESGFWQRQAKLA